MVSSPDPYGLAQDRSAVHGWAGGTGRTPPGLWSGARRDVSTGGAGLCATDPVDGRIFAYGGKGEAWSYAGAAGVDRIVTYGALENARTLRAS